MHKLLTAAEVATRLGVSDRTVRYWANAGTLPGQKNGQKLWRFDLDTVTAFAGAESTYQKGVLNIASGAEQPISTRQASEEILRWLIALGFSQKEISMEMQVDQSTVSRWMSEPWLISRRNQLDLRRFARRALQMRLNQVLNSPPEVLAGAEKELMNDCIAILRLVAARAVGKRAREFGRLVTIAEEYTSSS